MLANLLYAIALVVASPLVLYRMVRHGRYRRGISEKLLGLSKHKADHLRGGSSCVWLHAVSVGEVNLLPGLVRQFKAVNRDFRFAVSTSTDTGYDLAVKHFGAEHVFFCPLDFTWAVKRTLRNLAPEKLLLAELELWPNLIRIAQQRGCEVAIFNGRLSERSAAGYLRFGVVTRPIFGRLAWVGCQDESSAKRFTACGTPQNRVQITGSLKFDDAPTSRQDPGVQSRYRWSGADRRHCVWIVGSSGPGEEAMALNIYKTLAEDHSELRLVLVPRHAERFDAVAELVISAGLKVRRRSKDRSSGITSPAESPQEESPQEESPQEESQWGADQVILVDTIGELRQWWGVGLIATVGGSFGSRGGQNMLEPAGYGNAVSFGPDTRNFKEIAQHLLSKNAAVRVANESELSRFVQRCLTDRGAIDSLGRAAKSVVDSHRGATDKTVGALESVCETKQRGPQVACLS